MRPRRPSCRASRMSGNAPPAVRSRPAGSIADGAAATTTVRNSAPVTNSPRPLVASGRRNKHVRDRSIPRRPPRRGWCAPAVLSPPQILPVLRCQCPEDRLQGRAAVVPLPVGARQDRAQSNHGRFGQEATGTRGRHQARAVPRVASLHRRLRRRDLMAAVELILLQRVEKLGQMGDIVKVKPGFARNFLLPQKKALRATTENRSYFDNQKAQLEAQNLRRKEEAERVAERVAGLSVVVIRQAGESGSLYGSVSNRDIAEACTASGLTVDRSQVVLNHPIKTLGLTQVRVVLHPEVSLAVTVNVARSPEEAARQTRGESVGAAAEREEAPTADALFDPGAGDQPDVP